MSYRSITTYVRYLWRTSPVGIIAAVLLFAIGSASLAGIPLVVGQLIGAMSEGEPRDVIVKAAWMLFGFSVLHTVFWRLGEVVDWKLLTPATYRFPAFLFADVISRPYQYFVGRFTGKIGSHITNYGDRMTDLLDRFLYGYVSQVVTMASLAAVLTSVNWQSGAVFAAGLVLMYVVARPIMRRLVTAEGEFSDQRGEVSGRYVDAVANFALVRSYGRAPYETRTTRAAFEKLTQTRSRAMMYEITMWGLMSIIVRVVVWGAVIWVNVWLYLNGEATVADMSTVITAAVVFTNTVWDSIWYVTEFNQLASRAEESHKYLLQDDELGRGSDDDEPKENVVGGIAVRAEGLSFAYPDKTDIAVLRDVTLAVKAGEKVGVVGRSGSGKSTLMKLLLGYYEPTAGTLSISDAERELTYPTQHMGYVPQDTGLFHRTVAENLAYGVGHEVPMEQLREASKRAHAEEFIDKLPQGYDTLVGERGVKLSGGQRQRIAIARAFLADQPLLLLDEATSALDSDSEVAVQDALEALWEGKTVIAIAHRLSTLQRMDRIVVMEDGHVVEQGTHAELLARDGTFARLWRQQTGGFIPDTPVDTPGAHA